MKSGGGCELRLDVTGGPFKPRPALFGREGARRRATPAQILILLALLMGGLALLHLQRTALLHLGHAVFLGGFGLAVAIKLAVQLIPPATADAASLDMPRDRLPRYTVIAPLFREAEIVPELVRALAALDYPRDRLEVIFALEADDAPTREAIQAHAPADARVVFPSGGPRTKPNACNAALAVAKGEFVVVYDAEDRPHPQQLREAAGRFALGGPALVCLQAPLRIDRVATLLQRQFALEYATLFDVTLPALARLGLAFPLGGSSNHFRREALDAVGGWDAYNVTEDADIGLRLGACDGRLDMLVLPTWEVAPSTLAVWKPQRTRWIKGHLQTWLVHMRRPWAGGLKGFLTLQMTLGLGVASAVFHGPAVLVVAAWLTLPLLSELPPAIPPADAILLVSGWAAAAAAMRLGARQAGVASRATDFVLALGYWPLQSWAAAFAAWELAVCPHHWNKTPHEAETAVDPRREPVRRRRRAAPRRARPADALR